MNSTIRCLVLSAIIAASFLVFNLGKDAVAAQDGKAKETGAFSALVGKWSGMLEYADFKDDSRTRLPTELEAKSGNEGNSVLLNFIYEEPSGKKVTGFEALSFDSGSGKCRFGNSEYSVSGVSEFIARRSGQIVLTGQSKENGLPVDARLTINLEGDTLTILKETRSPLKFRNQYTLKKVK